MVHHIRYAEIKASLSAEKKAADGTFTKVLYRPVSWPLSWLFLNMRVHPNTISLVGALFCVAAFGLVLTPFFVAHVAAVFLFILFAIFDCVDGNMARTLKKKSIYGGWIDAICGYFAYTTEIAALGFSTFYFASSHFNFLIQWSPFGKASWIILTCVASSANNAMRLFYQAKKNAELRAGLAHEQGGEKRLSEEVGITGYMPILFGFGLVFDFLPIVCLTYSALYIGGFALFALKLIRKYP